MDFLKHCLTGADLQAECYYRLKLLSIESYLEYRHKNCRFDMIIPKGNKIIAIIEFKAYRRSHSNLRSGNTKQFKKYSSYGIPVIYCKGKDEIDQTINQIKQLFYHIHS